MLSHASSVLARSRQPYHIGAMRKATRWTLLALCVATLGCHADTRGSDARTQLATVRRDSVVATASPHVSAQSPAPLPADTSARSPAMGEACDAYAKILTASATASGIAPGEVGPARDTIMAFAELQGERPEPDCLVDWKDEVTREVRSRTSSRVRRPPAGRSATT